ncbi:hypothetical protein F4778DRAFT_781656 [Xylariomycetidae sp. FL2044]|nr:hypothetical protein F4778DRAFT_781656 [Xylariomycetidae sp. FL2044]
MAAASRPAISPRNLEGNIYAGLETSPRDPDVGSSSSWPSSTTRRPLRRAQRPAGRGCGVGIVLHPARGPVETGVRRRFSSRRRCAGAPVMADAVPHRAAAQDEYAGFRIPAGALVMANSWGINRDTRVFRGEDHDIEDFVPERWLDGVDNDNDNDNDGDVDSGGVLRRDLPSPVFGAREKDEDGGGLGVEDLGQPMRHTFTVVPKPFDLRIVPRGDWVDEVIEREWAKAEKNAEVLLGEVDDRFDDPAAL